jgi:hypothetical protein
MRLRKKLATEATCRTGWLSARRRSSALMYAWATASWSLMAKSKVMLTLTPSYSMASMAGTPAGVGGLRRFTLPYSRAAAESEKRRS